MLKACRLLYHLTVGQKQLKRREKEGLASDLMPNPRWRGVGICQSACGICSH